MKRGNNFFNKNSAVLTQSKLQLKV